MPTTRSKGKNATESKSKSSSSKKSVSKSSNGWIMKSSVFMIFVALSVVYIPNFWWHTLIIFDFFTPWAMFEDPYVKAYHNFLISRLESRPELPAIELPLAEANSESVYKLSKGYTVPIIIRGAIANATAITKWTDKDFWLNNYPEDNVMCKFVGGVDNPACTMKEAFGETGDERIYISGESRLFENHPELEEMVSSPFLDSLINGKRLFTQIFMGFPKMGSDIHSAIGCNVFRQIAGRKKWWLIPVTQTPYVYASLNANGFSSHTKTLVGKQDQQPSPWLDKIERYTVVLEPGDILINTAWYWHGIINLGEDDNELVIGVPTRYRTGLVSSLSSNFLFTLIAGYAINRDVGSIEGFLKSTDEFQKGIEKARRKRGEEGLKKMEAERAAKAKATEA